MEFTTTSHCPQTQLEGRISLQPEELAHGRLRGQIKVELPAQSSTPTRYLVKQSQDVLVAPYEFSVASSTHQYDVSIRITDSNPHVVVGPDPSASEDRLPVYRFQFPDLRTLRHSSRFLREGLTEDLVDAINDTYEHSRSPLFGFIEEAKYCLDYAQYVRLLAGAATVDEQVYWDLAHSRHGFIKNLIRGQKAGTQFPIRNRAEFASRTAEYESYDSLKPLDHSRIVENLIKEASSHGTHIDDICSLNKSFIEVVPDLSTGFFVHLVTEALLTDFTVNTATRRFENEFQVSPDDLVNQRYKDWDVTTPYDELVEVAYESRSITDWERALASVSDIESAHFYQALGDLLYWYTETTNGIPEDIQPKVYATAATLYEEVHNDFMADAASYRASLKEGFFLRQNGSYENALVEFFRANKICQSWNKGPFDEVYTFIQSILTDIARYRNQGNFVDAVQKADYGHTELTQGEYQEQDTERYETLLLAWKHDMQAQNQRANSQFNDAIDTTNKAIARFREAGEEGAAQTAQTRRYQLQAIKAQLNLTFDEAASHHQSARKEAPSGRTAHLHASEADLCAVKQHILEAQLESARKAISDCDHTEPTVNNLDILIDVYDDYLHENLTSMGDVIERLDTSREELPQVGRHISYHGDYVSAVIHVVAAQRLKQKNLPPTVLDHITRAAIKNAISGGTSRQWSEVSELSQIDAENIWRLLIPSVIQKDLEYVEYISEKGTFPNYAAPGMKLLAALEGYLRVMVEYYAKLEYEDQWEDEVVSGPGLSFGDIYTFFESDTAATPITTRDEIYTELDEMRYFDEDSHIRDVRNDLDHNDLSWLDNNQFIELESHVFAIMRQSAFDCPVIGETDEVNEQHPIYFASVRLQWNRLPRRVEVSTEAELEVNQSVYLPPDLTIESGMTKIDPEFIRTCELKPEQVREPHK